LFLFLNVGLVAHADPVDEDTTGLEALYLCRGNFGETATPWALKDNDETFLSVDPKKPNFEIRPDIQTALICGNAVRAPDAVIQIHPTIQVRSSKKGSTPNFERLPEGGFKFWLSNPDKSRVCEVTCSKVK
jgi:hypothetical protein